MLVFVFVFVFVVFLGVSAWKEETRGSAVVSIGFGVACFGDLIGNGFNMLRDGQNWTLKWFQ